MSHFNPSINPETEEIIRVLQLLETSPADDAEAKAFLVLFKPWANSQIKNALN